MWPLPDISLQLALALALSVLLAVMLLVVWLGRHEAEQMVVSLQQQVSLLEGDAARWQKFATTPPSRALPPLPQYNPRPPPGPPLQPQPPPLPWIPPVPDLSDSGPRVRNDWSDSRLETEVKPEPAFDSKATRLMPRRW